MFQFVFKETKCCRKILLSCRNCPTAMAVIKHRITDGDGHGRLMCNTCETYIKYDCGCSNAHDAYKKYEGQR